MKKRVCLNFSIFGLVLTFCPLSDAQQWELGAMFGLAASHDTAISSPAGSGQTGFPMKGVVGVVLGEDLYQYFSGEFRYMYRWGGPKLTANGTQASMNGYANVLTYEVLVHMKSRESRFRPFVAGGAGIKIYTGIDRQSADQPLANVALLRSVTQVEPVVSAGAGLKYLVTRGVQLRFDFRTYTTPVPNDLIRPVGRSVIHGWTYDFVPMLGVSYAF